MVNGWWDGFSIRDIVIKECAVQDNILVEEMELYIKEHDIKALMELVMKAIDNVQK